MFVEDVDDEISNVLGKKVVSWRMDCPDDTTYIDVNLSANALSAEACGIKLEERGRSIWLHYE